MADYSHLYLRRFASEVLPFLYLLVVGELRGGNTNSFELFASALRDRELREIAEDQASLLKSTPPKKGYCMYLVNFHDYVEAILHANMDTLEQDIGTFTYSPNLIEVRKILTHLELAPNSDLEELHREVFAVVSTKETSKFGLLMQCLHIYFAHILVLNIELERAKRQIANKKKAIASAKVCVAPEFPTYLVDALKSANQYCTGDTEEKQSVDIASIFARETNIGYNILTSLPEYGTITPIIQAYANTLQPIPDQSSSWVDICDSILRSELWRDERSCSI